MRFVHANANPLQKIEFSLQSGRAQHNRLRISLTRRSSACLSSYTRERSSISTYIRERLRYARERADMSTYTKVRLDISAYRKRTGISTYNLYKRTTRQRVGSFLVLFILYIVGDSGLEQGSQASRRRCDSVSRVKIANAAQKIGPLLVQRSPTQRGRQIHAS